MEYLFQEVDKNFAHFAVIGFIFYYLSKALTNNVEIFRY
jgi:hypothetical protein